MRHILLSFLLILPAVVFAQSEVDNNLRVERGTVKRFEFHSQTIGQRNVDVWLPEGYSSDKKYAVLYMHDGQMLFDSTATWNGRAWHIDRTLQKLIDSGLIQDVIVVGVWNSADRHAEYFPQKALQFVREPELSQLCGLFGDKGSLADNYLAFLTREVKPFIDTTFATHTEREHTFVAGSSMGGLISLYAMCEYPEIFGGAGCLSTHWIGTFARNNAIPTAIDRYLRKNLPSPDGHKIYFDYGTVGLDANYPDYQKEIDKTLKRKKYDQRHTVSLEFAGDDHNEDCWAARFSSPATFLLEIMSTTKPN